MNLKAAILIPVKDLSRAKARMSNLLTVEERARVAWAMFEDVTEALTSLPLPADVVLVTDSAATADRARRMNWRVLWESNQISESASVDSASAVLALEGTEAVLRLPADLPLVRPEDIYNLLQQTPLGNSAMLVPSWDKHGTNAVLRRPPLLFPSRFGHNSFVLHLQEAMRVQASLSVRENPRIALDLDEPHDLHRFLELKSDTRTNRLLVEMGIEERLFPHVH